MFSLENLLLTVEQEAKVVPLKQQIETQSATLNEMKSKVLTLFFTPSPTPSPRISLEHS
jgi:hypothetical protein